MSDLQCPATAVILEAGTARPSWLRRAAAEFDADGADVGRLVEETTDLFRGETFVVWTPLADAREVLRKHGIPTDPPVAVEVDSSGWRLARLG